LTAARTAMMVLLWLGERNLRHTNKHVNSFYHVSIKYLINVFLIQ
jgi:hypothetical protein